MDEHAQHAHHQSTANIKLAFWLNTFFALVQFIGGWWTNSLIILSSALHDLGDSFALGFSWYFDRLSKTSRTPRFSYGLTRFSLIPAVINSLILISGSLFIITEAIKRILTPEPSSASGMLLFAIVGILVNGVAVLRLRSGKSMNERVVSLHLLDDVLTWGVVLVVAGILYFYNLPTLDPLLSVLITFYVLMKVGRTLIGVFTVLLQGMPGEIRIDDLEARMRKLPDVVDVHDTHIWTLDGVSNILTMHAVVPDHLSRTDRDRVKHSVRVAARDTGIAHATVEIERESERCGLKKH